MIKLSKVNSVICCIWENEEGPKKVVHRKSEFKKKKGHINFRRSDQFAVISLESHESVTGDRNRKVCLLQVYGIPR